MNEYKILIFNTYAFDFLLVAISISDIECKNYKMYVDNNIQNNFINLCKEVAFHGTTHVTCEKRALLLIKNKLFIISYIESGTSILD